MNNFSIPVSSPTDLSYTADVGCYHWCLDQQVVHTTNINVYAIMILGAVYLCHMLYFVSQEYEQLEKYGYSILYISRLLLLLFFIYYFGVVKYGLV